MVPIEMSTPHSYSTSTHTHQRPILHRLARHTIGRGKQTVAAIGIGRERICTGGLKAQSRQKDCQLQSFCFGYRHFVARAKRQDHVICSLWVVRATAVLQSVSGWSVGDKSSDAAQ